MCERTEKMLLMGAPGEKTERARSTFRNGIEVPHTAQRWLTILQHVTVSPPHQLKITPRWMA